MGSRWGRSWVAAFNLEEWAFVAFAAIFVGAAIITPLVESSSAAVLVLILLYLSLASYSLAVLWQSKEKRRPLSEMNPETRHRRQTLSTQARHGTAMVALALFAIVLFILAVQPSVPQGHQDGSQSNAAVELR